MNTHLEDAVENTQPESRASGPAAPWAGVEGAALRSHPPSRQIALKLWALNRLPLSHLDTKGRRQEEVSRWQASGLRQPRGESRLGCRGAYTMCCRHLRGRLSSVSNTSMVFILKMFRATGQVEG